MRSPHELAARHLRFWEALDKAREEAQPAQLPPGDRMVVTVSRQEGSRGEEIARGVAQRLGYQLFDREIVDYLATTAHVRRRLVELHDETTHSSLEDSVSTLLDHRAFAQTAYLRHLATALASIAAGGRAVIVGRGASQLLASPFVLRVRVIAPLGVRIENFARESNLPLRQARRLLRATDRQRDAFIRRHFRRDPNDPLNCDMILNTATVGPTEGIEAICAAVRARVALLTESARRAG